MDDQIRNVASGWLLKAGNDLLNAEHTLKLGKKAPFDTVCFHAQQCVEKCLKALLVCEGIPFPRTHDIRMLFESVAEPQRPDLTDDEMDILTDYATITRYPGDYEAIEYGDALTAVQIAVKTLDKAKKYVLI